MTLAPYKYKPASKRQPRFNYNRLPRANPNADIPPLTGWVNGERASDIEERFARALRNAGYEFAFQVDVPVRTSLPGQPKSVDFVVTVNGLRHPVEIDGEIGHKTPSQQASDQMRESLLNPEFLKLRWALLKRVTWYQLGTQAAADTLVRRMFLV